MGIVSVGRSLVVRQVFLSSVILALGGYAYASMHGVEGFIDTLSTANPQAASAATLLYDATSAAEMHVAIATFVAALLMIVVSVPVIHLTISRPLKEIATAVDELAAGNHTASVKGSERADEIGVIARGLCTLREASLSAARAAMSAVPAAPDPQLRVFAENVERFSLEFAAHVRRLGTMTRRLSEAAEQMTAAAKHANEGSDKATTASSNAAGDVSSVATASEQLLDSIEEISRQVVQSTNVVRGAVERAVETNAGMGRLSTAAQKVGDVVSLISRIAAQTNLLALNATIEAARAGEAGRGFAVVAQEVKTLATQTAKATQDITGQIAEMQQATDLSVDAIDKIQKKIAEVEHISTIIASAVHEQGAATQEIARNVRSAAAGTASMSGHIENVVRSIGETSMNAASMSTLARELEEIASGMTDMVGTFTQTLKAA